MNDHAYMQMALSLARRGIGRTAPNPAVGCVLVKNGRIVGRGWTQPGGRPHAEAVALAQAGVAAQGATAYVTLEPCAHHGQTPPCAEALIAAGIARVVVACTDPDPRTAGNGISVLAQAGIETWISECEAEARLLNAGFFLRMEKGRPWVTLKLATSLDGCIATASGESQWITGEAARRHAHLLRAQHDAILTGIGTVLADDPLLTCRLPGMEERSPIRIVLDSQLRMPRTSQLVKTAREVPLWVMTCSQDTQALSEAGVRVVTLPELSPEAVLSQLAGEGINRLLVEAGPRVSSSFHAAWLVDALYWYRAPFAIGNEGKQALHLPNKPLKLLRHLQLRTTQRLGPDTLEIYRNE